MHPLLLEYQVQFTVSIPWCYAIQLDDICFRIPIQIYRSKSILTVVWKFGCCLGTLMKAGIVQANESPTDHAVRLAIAFIRVYDTLVSPCMLPLHEFISFVVEDVSLYPTMSYTLV